VEKRAVRIRGACRDCTIALEVQDCPGAKKLNLSNMKKKKETKKFGEKKRKKKKKK